MERYWLITYQGENIAQGMNLNSLMKTENVNIIASNNCKEEKRYQQKRATSRKSSPTGLKHGLDRTDKNQQIKPSAEMAQIIEIVGKLEVGILNAAGIGGTNLSPAAQAGTHPITLTVMRDMSFQILLELGTLWTWTDEAHLAVEHTKQLW